MGEGRGEVSGRKGLVLGRVMGFNDGKICEGVPTISVEGRGKGFGEGEEKREESGEGRVMSPTPGTLPLWEGRSI